MALPQHQVIFPPEIMEQIFGYLDPSSLLNCSRVCKKWRNLFVKMTSYPQIGYIPKIMSKIFHYLSLDPNDLPIILAARQTCTLWKLGLDKLTLQNSIRLHCKSSISSSQANQLLRWRIEEKVSDSIRSNHNPFPSRTIRLQLIPEGIVSNVDMLSLTSALSLYGSQVHFLDLKIQQSSPSSQTISQEPYHHPIIYMLKLARTLLQILSYMENLKGLSIHITSEFCSVEMPDLMWKEEKDRIHAISLKLQNLTAFRLISWSFRSNEMEWLYYKILRSSPNLEFFDPDFHLGYEKIYRICSEQNNYPFRLKCLKIAVPPSVMPQFFRSLRKMRNLRIVHLDVFKDDGLNCVSKCSCAYILHNLIKCTRGKLTTISLAIYQNSRFVPNCEAISSRSPSSDLLLLRDMPTNMGQISSTSKLKKKIKEIIIHHYMSFLSLPSSYYNNLKNLRLRGIAGQIGFLKKFPNLNRLILLDYDPICQTDFKQKCDFYRLLPSLKELYSPYFGFSLEHGHKLLLSIVDDENNAALKSMMHHVHMQVNLSVTIE